MFLFFYWVLGAMLTGDSENHDEDALLIGMAGVGLSRHCLSFFSGEAFNGRG